MPKGPVLRRRGGSSRGWLRSAALRATPITTIIIVVLALAPASARAARTPIARWDLVPMERIRAGETLEAGVIAFSKEGIEKVRFQVAGPGHAGKPIDVREMSFNPRSEVWEYWIPVCASEFSAAGVATLSVAVYGKDGGVRTLEPMTLMVDPANELPVPEAWVSTTGNDATGEVNDPNKPFRTILAAALKVRNWMNGSGFGPRCDGALIRLLPGEHGVTSGEIPTVSEWVTITLDPARGGTKANTIINQSAGSLHSLWLKVAGITLQSMGNAKYLFNPSPNDPLLLVKKLWLHDCRIIGFNRYADQPDPIGQNYRNRHFTSCDIFNVRRGTGNGPPATIVRNTTIEQIGEDAFQNAPLVVNVKLNNVDPGPPGGPEWHADAWQSHGDGPNNRIVYNFHATDLHYQGIFARAQTPAEGNAFVNCLIELREPIRDYGLGSAGGSSAFVGKWKHLLLWHSTFLNHHIYFDPEPTTGLFEFRDCSFIGNVFHSWRNASSGSPGTEPPWTLPGNALENVFLHNHYITSFTDGIPGSHVHSRSPDTGASQSLGDPLLQLDPLLPGFAVPLAGSLLLDRLDGNSVLPADVDSDPREALADLGAFEVGTAR